MSDSSTPFSNLVNKGETKYMPAGFQNPSWEKDGRDNITPNFKMWVIIPMLTFLSLGFIALSIIAHEFLYGEINPPEFAWPALILSFAGIPFTFVTGIKKMIDVLITSPN